MARDFSKGIWGKGFIAGMVATAAIAVIVSIVLAVNVITDGALVRELAGVFAPAASLSIEETSRIMKIIVKTGVVAALLAGGAGTFVVLCAIASLARNVELSIYQARYLAEQLDDISAKVSSLKQMHKKDPFVKSGYIKSHIDRFSARFDRTGGASMIPDFKRPGEIV